MRFFALIDFQHMVLALFLGLSAAVAVYLAWSGYSHKRERDLDERELAELRIRSEENPVAPVLLLIYVAVVVCVILYLLIIGIFGGPF
jgi:Ca2+/Na+ antiporter